jgi:Tfp pilus assembly protein PilF
MTSAVQVELHRQANVIIRGSQISPKKYRKQEERLSDPEEQALRHSIFATITETQMIRKLTSGQYRLYSKKKDKSGKRKNLGTFKSLAAAKKHERAVQYFKRAG